ncbi:MAG: hypothetical protein RLZZ124_731 [Cyanobacteriota bacterium]|jgi:hypothetical protein
MGHGPSCRSCRHCQPPLGEQVGWCALRRLPIHPELAGDLWCHHWTARPPRLPQLLERQRLEPLPQNRQLALPELLEG